MDLKKLYKTQTGRDRLVDEPMYVERGYSFGQEQYPYTNEYVEWLEDRVKENAEKSNENRI